MQVIAERSFAEQLRAAYQHQVYRDGLFATLAELTRSPERCEKWRVLRQLQLQTKLRLRPVLERHAVATAEDPARRARGQRHGHALVRLRWMDFMDSLLAEASNAISGFEAVERSAPRADAPTLGRATATEVAVQSFARLELAGRGAESVAPALALLDRGPVAAPLAIGQA